MKKIIYVDNAATTRVSDAAMAAMLPFFQTDFGNPSSTIYSMGKRAAKAVDESRAIVAQALHAKPSEIFFTSGGSEADNWAIKGAAAEQAKKGKKHIITSKFEHHAVLHAVDSLAKSGYDVTYLDVHEDGIIRPDELKAALRPDTALVTIMYANNEIGTIQPIAELGAICREAGIIFHTDAVQAAGHVPIDVAAEQIDLLSISGHKFHGPKGVGALYIRSGVKLSNLIDGGAQERGRRAGTENVPGIVGLAAALQESCDNMESNNQKISAMRDNIIDAAMRIERCRLNGHRDNRLPGTVNVSFEGIEGEGILLWLDIEGICASSGSACTSGSLDPSHVLLSIGLPHETAHGSLRISLDEYNTDEDVEKIIAVLPGIIEKLRAMSPLWEQIKNNR